VTDPIRGGPVDHERSAGPEMTDNQEPMSVEVARIEETVVLTLAGELDLHTSELLATALTDALGTDPKAVVVEAHALAFADSAGLRALLSARDAAQQQGVELRLGQVSPALGRLLDVTGLREVFGSPTG
jgi:anti-anti-sigma factor